MTAIGGEFNASLSNYDHVMVPAVAVLRTTFKSERVSLDALLTRDSMTRFADTVGTNDSDDLTGNTFTISYGLHGDDHLSSRAGASYQVLYGGFGNDRYTIGSGHVATIYDTEGNDVVDIDGLPFNNDNSVIATIEGRHLLAGNLITQTEVYILDYRDSSIGTIILDDVTLNFDTLIRDVQSLPGYLGDVTFDELRAQGTDVPGSAEARSDIANAVVRETQLQAEANLLELPELPDLPDLPELPELPELPDLPELPEIPELPELTRDDALGIARLYGGTLGREPDIPGMNFWIDEAEAGLSQLEAAGFFLDSPEFTEKFGNDDAMSNTQFVNVMYENVLGRANDAPGLDFWVSQMDAGLSREETAVFFADSDENIASSTYLDTFREALDGDWLFG